MPVTIESIDEQIRMLQAKKKALQEKEAQAEQEGYEVAVAFYGQLIFKTLDIDWKELDPTLFKEWVSERKDKICETCADAPLNRKEALRRIKSCKK